MRIRRIEVRSFRKLGHVVVEGLGEGLNVLVGDNEAGKSTLLEALRAGLFVRHRIGGLYADGLQPYGEAVRPEVAIDFELGETRWSLRKAFCQKPEAELIGPGERLTGEAVEERLAGLLGFVPPGRGEPNPEEHHGIHGLLWVAQGTAHGAFKAGPHRDAIASALESEVGQVMGGERGRALLAAAEARRAEHWTRTGKPRGERTRLAEEVRVLGQRRDDVARRLEDYRGKVEALAAKTELLGRIAREDRLGRAREALARATRAVEATEVLSGAAADAAARLARCREDRARAEERAVRRQQAIGAVEEAKAAAAQARSDAEDAQEASARQAARADAAEAELRRRRELRVSAEERLRALERAAARRAGMARLAELEETLGEAEKADGRRRSRVAAVEASLLTADAVARLERLQAAVDRTTFLVDAASVRITVESERPVILDGRPLDGEASLTLSRDAVLDLEGFGRLLIHPGGGLEPLRQAAEEARDRLAGELRKLSVASAEEAKDRYRRSKEAELEATALAGTVAALAPRGLETLRQAVESARAQLAVPLDEAAAALQDVDGAELAKARCAVEGARGAERDAEAAITAIRAMREETGRHHAELAGRSASAARRLADVTRDLALQREAAADEALSADLGAWTETVAAADLTHRRAQAQLAAADVEAARLGLEMARRAEASIAADITTLERQKRDLEIELATRGHDGLGEEQAELEGQLAAAEARLEAMETEARAARLLHDTLSEAQRETRDRWLGPVRERVQPYLRLVHPDSEIELDEATLGIAQFVRGGRSERFEALSVGAREQVAVITRLALADLVRVSGRPAAIILDDALVNTDEVRLERMHLVLHKAAQSMQILILTCRERDFAQLGAPMRRI
jgi:DNA repair exonuclease SbcCD ATPase subunit